MALHEVSDLRLHYKSSTLVYALCRPARLELDRGHFPLRTQRTIDRQRGGLQRVQRIHIGNGHRLAVVARVCARHWRCCCCHGRGIGIRCVGGIHHGIGLRGDMLLPRVGRRGLVGNGNVVVGVFLVGRRCGAGSLGIHSGGRRVSGCKVVCGQLRQVSSSVVSMADAAFIPSAA